MWAVKLLCVWAVATIPVLCFQVNSEQSVRHLVEAAERSARPQPWAAQLIRADAEAAALERKEQHSSGSVRSVKVADGIDLHYRWNEIQASENYQHDLLRRVVSNLRGTTPVRLATETGPFWKFILAHPKLMFSSPAFALAEMGK